MYAVITVNVAVTPKKLDLPRLGDVSNSSEFDFKRQLGVYARSLTLKRILNFSTTLYRQCVPAWNFSETPCQRQKGFNNIIWQCAQCIIIERACMCTPSIFWKQSVFLPQNQQTTIQIRFLIMPVKDHGRWTEVYVSPSPTYATTQNAWNNVI